MGWKMFVFVLVHLNEGQSSSCMCFQAQTSAGDPPLLVS